MKAIKVVEPGKAEVQTVPVPKLRDDYVLVKTDYIGLNPTDWYVQCLLTQPDSDSVRRCMSSNKGLDTINLLTFTLFVGSISSFSLSQVILLAAISPELLKRLGRTS